MTELADIRLYTLDEVAMLLGISMYTARKYCRDKTIKAVKAGKSWKVPQESLDKYLRRWLQMMMVSIFLLALCGLYIIADKLLTEEQWERIINKIEGR